MNTLNTIISRVRPMLRHTCVLLALCASARATVIQPNTAVASSVASAPYVAINTINGSGLTGPVATLPTHAAYSSASGGNHWTSDGSSPLDEFITWGFSSPQTLDTIYLWNHQSNGGLASNPGYDVGDFALTFFNSASLVIGSYSGTLAFDSNAAQTFVFGALAGISSVRFDVNSVQSSPNFTGLAEVAFNTATITPGVPDSGATAALLGLSVLALGIFSRRRSMA